MESWSLVLAGFVVVHYIGGRLWNGGTGRFVLWWGQDAEGWCGGGEDGMVKPRSNEGAGNVSEDAH